MTKTIPRHTFNENLPATDWNNAAQSIEEVYPNSAGGLMAGTGPSTAPVEVGIGSVGDRLRRKTGENQPSWDSSPTFNVRDYGAVGDGVTNDLTAFRDTSAAVKTAGGGTIQIPPGNYLFSTSTTTGAIVWQWAIESDNTRIVWERGAKITSAVTDARVLIAYGSAKPTGMADWATTEYRDATAYDLTGTGTKGQRTITTATAADAGNFAAGDLVYIRTGQLVTGLTDTEPDSEINKVLSVDAGTGIVTLAWPLTKNYAQEYYISGTTGLTSTTVTANLAPYKISKVTDRTLLNFELINPVIECSGSALQAISVWGIVGFRWSGGNILVPKNGLGSRDVRFAECSGFRIERQDQGSRAYFFGPSTGCSHWHIHDFMLVSDGDGYLHFHEGVAQTRAHHFSVENANFDGTDPLIDIRLRAHDLHIDHWAVRCNNASEQNAVLITETPSSGKLAHGRVMAGNAAANIRVDVDGWEDLPTNVVTNGRISLRAPQVGKGIGGTTQYLSGAVIGTTGAQQLTPTLGTLPRNAIPLRVVLYVETAFNSDGTDTIKLGHASDDDAYFTATDVSTTGAKTPTAGVSLGLPELTSARSLVATYTAGGSSPTTGKAHVLIEYALGARSD